MAMDPAAVAGTCALGFRRPRTPRLPNRWPPDGSARHGRLRIPAIPAMPGRTRAVPARVDEVGVGATDRTQEFEVLEPGCLIHCALACREPGFERGGLVFGNGQELTTT